MQCGAVRDGVLADVLDDLASPKSYISKQLAIAHNLFLLQRKCFLAQDLVFEKRGVI